VAGAHFPAKSLCAHDPFRNSLRNLVTRALLGVFVVATLSLGFAVQPPIESSLGTFPTPPAVGMTASVEPGPHTLDGEPMGETDLFKYAFTQGGVTLVALFALYFYRRDFLSKTSDNNGDKQILIDLVERNTTAAVTSAEANNRLARVLERKETP
jgi:hypothetical protein